MNIVTTTSAAEVPTVGSSESVSRREFVARLRRTTLFMVPVVAAIALTAPSASAGY